MLVEQVYFDFLIIVYIFAHVRYSKINVYLFD